MSFKATVYRILIASPGDVGEERDIIPDVINEWNAVSAFATKIILMPVKWETHTSPLLGGRPQSIINEQIVKDADLLVGVFWTRIGTATGEAISGTAEEIQHFVEGGKPVMLYFSQSPVDPDKIDIRQFSTLKTFKEKMRLRGLTESYVGTTDFRQKFTRQLAINLNNLIDALNANLSARGKTPSKATTRSAKEAIDTLTKVTPEEAREYLMKAFQNTARDDGWAELVSFASYLHIFTPVDFRQFGHKKLKPYLESTGLFTFRIPPGEKPSNMELALRTKASK